MKLIIDIDEELKSAVCNYSLFLTPTDKMSLIDALLIDAIKNGTPLPKGHGRLIDADEFIKEKTKIFCENCDRRRGMKDGKLTKHFVYDIGDAPCRACDTGDMIDYVDDAPTIIEADKAERSE